MGGRLKLEHVTCGYGAKQILSDVNLDVDGGEVLVILGKNGVGKTTLFKTIVGLLPALGGIVYLDGDESRAWSARKRAQHLAYVPQTHAGVFGYAVRDMVLMGRTPYIGGALTPGSHDDEVANAVMGRLGIAHLADRDCTTLSGGELQMVLVARALAQEPSVLMMDEPCASLDLGNQRTVLETIARQARSGMAVVATSHDPNHAFLLDCNVICIGQNQEPSPGQAEETERPDGPVSAGHGQSTILAQGRARDVLTDELLSQLYGVPIVTTTYTDEQGRTIRMCGNLPPDL